MSIRFLIPFLFEANVENLWITVICCGKACGKVRVFHIFDPFAVCSASESFTESDSDTESDSETVSVSLTQMNPKNPVGYLGSFGF